MAALPEAEVEGAETDLGNFTSGCHLRLTPSLLSRPSSNPSPEHTRQHQNLSQTGKESQSGLGWKDLGDHPTAAWFTSPGHQHEIRQELGLAPGPFGAVTPGKDRAQGTRKEAELHLCRNTRPRFHPHCQPGAAEPPAKVQTTLPRFELLTISFISIRMIHSD